MPVRSWAAASAASATSPSRATSVPASMSGLSELDVWFGLSEQPSRLAEIVEGADPAAALPDVQDTVHRHGAEAGDAKQFVPLGPVDIQREPFRMAPGPDLFRVRLQREAAVRLEGNLVVLEAILADEPVHLVEAVFARQKVLRAAGVAAFARQRRVAEPALVGAEVDAPDPAACRGRRSPGRCRCRSRRRPPR